MKKLLSLFAIFMIVMSVTLLFSCDSGSFCCENVHSNTAECATCSPHLESSYSTGHLHPEFILIPEIVGQIYYKVINTDQINVVFALDRPPAFIS